MVRGLLHRADCHASGVAPIAAWAALPDGDLEPIALCRHHYIVNADELLRRGWVIERLAEFDDCDSEVVKA